MRFLFLLFIINLFSSFYSQTTDNIQPVSNTLKTTLPIPIINLPSFDIQQVLEDEYNNRLSKTGKYMFGYEHQTNINFFTDASITTLPDESILYLLSVKSLNALSINIIFNDFFIPKGARLHVYDKDKTTVIGAYTSENNNINNTLGTDLILGDEMIIEYHEPKNQIGKSNLNISTIVHGFEDINNWHNQIKVNESGACNMDVICPDGNPWEKEIRSVARIIVGGGFCTGSLVNTTANDGKAYFLTADHCGPQSMTSAVFRFNYDSPICGSQTSSNSQNATVNQTINGSSFIANNSNSDFGLVELNSIPPANYNVYYSGWNNSGNTPSTTVGIHHPRGDVKKISFDDNAPVSSSIAPSIANAEWRILQWDRNTTTEGGSSGSGLWDENHLLIGQLHGGAANCANSVNDYYGKFSFSWDGTSSTNRLRDWLDPQNTGITTLKGYDPNVIIQKVDVELVRIINPINISCLSPVIPKVLIKNNGDDTLTTLTLNYVLNSNNSQNLIWNGNLLPNDTTTVSFPSLNLINEGENNITIIASSPNDTLDENHSNDTLRGEFIHNSKCLAFPNPFKNELNINFEIEKTNQKPVTVSITDIQGKLIWSEDHNPFLEKELKINTSLFAIGSYILKIVYEQENSVQKLIKN